MLSDLAAALALLLESFHRGARGEQAMFELRHRLAVLGFMGTTLETVWKTRIGEGAATEDDYREPRDYSALFPEGFG